MRLVTIATLVATFVLGGCASIVSGHNQSVSVISQSEGTDIAGARCSLSNDKGQWFATTPGSVTVRRSYAALAVDCKSDAALGKAKVKSVTKPMVLGNILFGGLIGVGVDVASGAAYDYPEVISIPLVSRGGPAPTVAPASVAAIQPLSVEPQAVPMPIAAPTATPAAVARPPAAQLRPVVAKGTTASGQDSFSARRLAQSLQCNADPSPVMLEKGPGSETYSVACSNGDALAIRCDFGACRPLK